jgi:hypothetical protein
MVMSPRSFEAKWQALARSSLWQHRSQSNGFQNVFFHPPKCSIIDLLARLTAGNFFANDTLHIVLEVLSL